MIGAEDEHCNTCFYVFQAMKDETEEEDFSGQNYRCNIRTLKSTMLIEYNEIIYDNNENRLNIHSSSIIKET